MTNNYHEFTFGLDTMNEAINSGVKEGKRAALWKNLWYEKELTVLFGETNTGKSLLAVQIANFIDACFCMGAVSGQPDSVYIKQLKARTGKITLNENNVLVCNREKREDQFIVFNEIGYAAEKNLMRGGTDITPQKEKAFQLYNEGKSFREIAKIIGCSDKTAKKWIEDYQTFNQIKNSVSEGYTDNDCSENENI